MTRSLFSFSRLLALVAILVGAFAPKANAQSAAGWTVSYMSPDMDSVKIATQAFAIEGIYSLNIQYWGTAPGSIFRIKKAFLGIPWGTNYPLAAYGNTSGTETARILFRFIKGDSVSISFPIFITPIGRWGSVNRNGPFNPELSGIDTIEFQFGWPGDISGPQYSNINFDWLRQTNNQQGTITLDTFGDQGRIDGQVFYDANQDSLFNAGDRYLKDWKVYLYLPNWGFDADSAITDANGYFIFNNSISTNNQTYGIHLKGKPCWTQVFPQDTHWVAINAMDIDSTVNFAFYASNPTGYSVKTRWNLVSKPQLGCVIAKAEVFPKAVSNAYGYNNGYYQADTLKAMIGYWLKFPYPDTILLVGDLIYQDSVSCVAGWNLVGTTSFPMAAQSVTSYPGIITSQFFAYNNGYLPTDTLHPGQGYWVKVDKDATLYLGFPPAMIPAQTITIMDNGELPPPPPPEGEIRNPKSEIRNFALSQNWPNPFNPVTTIAYSLERLNTRALEHVTLTVHNILGQQVAMLVNEAKEAGSHRATWDATSQPSGIYIYRLQAGNRIAIEKMILIR